MKSFLSFINEREMINEGLSQVLFHFTHPSKALEITKGDRFELSTSLGTGAEQQIGSLGNNKFYYFSTARSRHGDYSSGYDTGVFFKLDGRKLQQNYSGGAVDYWGREFRKIDPKKFEMEDRIFSDEPFIEDAHKYITEISVLTKPMPEKSDDPEWDSLYKQMKAIDDISFYAKRHGIEMNVYTDGKAFRNGDKRKNQNKTYLYRADRGNNITAIIELLNADNSQPDKLSKNATEFLRNMGRYGGSLSHIKSEIHNEKSVGKQGKRDVDLMISIMKKQKLKTIEDVISKIEEKWKDL